MDTREVRNIPNQLLDYFIYSDEDGHRYKNSQKHAISIG